MILHGDCLTELRLMEANSVDAVVTDPPYGLSFMGKKWDYDVPSIDVWRECLRVLKPGGHMLVACGTRTQHRMVVNIEDAGFEIRDVITWLYGSGFPKSLDVSKAIDKAAGAEREVIGHNPKWNSAPRAMAPGHSDRAAMPAYTAPATDAAKQWQGFGTALKPAVEFWTLVRKPLGESTVAKNVLKHGTGGLNIDGCRVGETTKRNKGGFQNKGGFVGGKVDYTTSGVSTEMLPYGRFPANLILDEEAGALLDAQSGTLKSGSRAQGVRKGMGFHGADGDGGPAIQGNEGGASRFFYQAKVSSSERGDSKHPTMKPIRLMRYLCKLITPPSGVVLDPFAGSGSTGVAALQEGFQYIGIERESEYVEIARKRVEHERGATDLFTTAGDRLPEDPDSSPGG